MSTSFDLNRTGLLRVAYQLCGLVPAGEDPDSNQLSQGTDFLDLVLKDMQNYGIMLRKLERTTVTLTSGTASYSLASSTLDVDPMTAYVSDGNGTDLPMRMISRGQYMALTDKTTQGQPTQYYVEKAATIAVYLYPVPDSEWVSMTLPRVVVIDDMSSADTVTGLQAKYLKAITFGVCQLLSYSSGFPAKAAQYGKDFLSTLGVAKNDDTERGPTRLVCNYGLRMSKS